jgi:hypothetical protein
MNDEEMDDLVFLWKEYGLEDDSKLTKDAQGLKRAIRDFVQKLPKFVWYYQKGNFSIDEKSREAKP